MNMYLSFYSISMSYDLQRVRLDVFNTDMELPIFILQDYMNVRYTHLLIDISGFEY